MLTVIGARREDGPAPPSALRKQPPTDTRLETPRPVDSLTPVLACSRRSTVFRCALVCSLLPSFAFRPSAVPLAFVVRFRSSFRSLSSLLPGASVCVLICFCACASRVSWRVVSIAVCALREIASADCQRLVTPPLKGSYCRVERPSPSHSSYSLAYTSSSTHCWSEHTKHRAIGAQSHDLLRNSMLIPRACFVRACVLQVCEAPAQSFLLREQSNFEGFIILSVHAQAHFLLYEAIALAALLYTALALQQRTVEAAAQQSARADELHSVAQPPSLVASAVNFLAHLAFPPSVGGSSDKASAAPAPTSLAAFIAAASV